MEQIEADREKIASLESSNAQLRSALAAEKRERETERSELLNHITREQRHAHEAELARREAANDSVIKHPITTPIRASGEVAALIEELHALEAEAQRLVPRQSQLNR